MLDIRRATYSPSAVQAGRVLWLLTTASITVEIGLAVRLLASHAPLWSIGAVLAAFHTGYLVARVPLLGRRAVLPRGSRTVLLAAAFALLIVGMLRGLIVPLAAGAFLFSGTVQRWRRKLKPLSRMPTVVKNAGKAAGMLAASAFALPPTGAAGAVGVLGAGLALLSGMSGNSDAASVATGRFPVPGRRRAGHRAEPARCYGRKDCTMRITSRTCTCSGRYSPFRRDL